MPQNIYCPYSIVSTEILRNTCTQLISQSYNNSCNRVKVTPRGGVTIFGVKITPKRSYFFLVMELN